MGRNREIFLLAVAWLLVSTAGAALALVLAQSLTAAGLVLAVAVSLGAVYGVFTWWRYREIRRLSAYLSRVYSGGKPLDIRNNREGELSVLKNDLYKLTCVLTNQAEELYADRDYLAQALSNISHQLKTPLTSLFVMTDLLQNEALPPEKRREFVAGCNLQLERIQWLVTSLLTLSRIDARVIVFKQEPVPLDKLLHQAAQPLAAVLDAGERTLDINCPPELTWMGDYNWTLEALSNVIKNAAEHTPPGGRILVQAAENPLHIEITVTDSGPGIAQADLPHLFQRFYKGQNAHPGSVGIGLALAKTILQSQNGDILAENAPEGGARFIIKLYKQVV